MKVYALVGQSGTGKSYKAHTLASEMGIEYIIDDGLFIKGNKIIAGVSAKKESTKIAAVRRALFIHPEHAREVREAIRQVEPESVLILGTSARMINRIISRLDLPPVQEIIRIEALQPEEKLEGRKVSP